MNLLTPSRLRTFRDCHRKHQIEYLLRYRATAQSGPVQFGSVVHAGLEAWWSALQTPLFTDPMDSAQAAMLEHAGVGPYIESYELAKALALMRAYDTFYRGAMTSPNVEVLGVERPFEAPLMNPKTGRVSRTWKMAGVIDAIVKIDGETWLVEHKTTGEALDGGGSDYFMRLAMDPQITHYLIGSSSMGLSPKGILYDVLRRPTLRPLGATPLESRRFTKDGRLDARQRTVDEGAMEYHDRVAARIAQNPNEFFAQRKVARSIDDLSEYLHDIWNVSLSMHEAERSGAHPRNPDACNRYGPCPWWEHCASGLSLDDNPGWKRIDTPHPEMEGRR